MQNIKKLSPIEKAMLAVQATVYQFTHGLRIAEYEVDDITLKLIFTFDHRLIFVVVNDYLIEIEEDDIEHPLEKHLKKII